MGLGYFVSSDVNLLCYPQSHGSYWFIEAAKKNKLMWENFFCCKEKDESFPG